VGPGEHAAELLEIRKLAVLFDAMPLLPSRAITWLLETGAYRLLPRGLAVRQLVALVQTIAGDEATRARMKTILAAALGGSRVELSGGRPRRRSREREPLHA